MEVRLGHGREDARADMTDRGFDGPVLRYVHSLQKMYDETTTIRFHSLDAAREAQSVTGWATWDEDILEIPYFEDMVVTHEPDHPTRYYGDLFLIDAECKGDVRRATQCTDRAGRALREAIAALQKQPVPRV